MKSRAAVEPGIGHLKTEHRLNRNQLRGWDGDMHNVILSAAGMNFHKLLKHLRQLWLSILRGLGRLLGHKTLSQMSMRLSKVILHAA